jgi:hypothetical protein
MLGMRIAGVTTAMLAALRLITIPIVFVEALAKVVGSQ